MDHQSTRENISKLKTYSYKLIGPEIETWYGHGKENVRAKKYSKWNENILKIKKYKLKAIVTAGPTNEHIDPVRFITTNQVVSRIRDSKIIIKKGFDTTLISGPTN